MEAKRGVCLGLEREITNINKCQFKELAYIHAHPHFYPHTHTHTHRRTHTHTHKKKKK